MISMAHRFLTLILVLSGSAAWAVDAVNPTGVNVRSTGPTTVFLTFQGTEGQQPVDAFWCGDIAVPANTPTATNPCVPGTLFGHLPRRNDLSAASGNRGLANTTDIMTIPASVARRAYQAAIRGESSEFFYVRQFRNASGAFEYIAVTCRMAGGGARVPLALTSVDVSFETDRQESAVQVMARDQVAPPMSAVIHYNGSGRLKGRWEVVRPGDLEPEFEDLLTEASLPVELRGTQRRYTLLERFDVFLQPSGEVRLPGPDPSRIPTGAEGPYKILLRIEASADKEGNSDAIAGTVISGGVAGFPMPVLRYYVSDSGDLPGDVVSVVDGALTLLMPANDFQLYPGQVAAFSWAPVPMTQFYRLEVRVEDRELFGAIVKSDLTTYSLPGWVSVNEGDLLRWRVSAIDAEGNTLALSEWRRIVGH